MTLFVRYLAPAGCYHPADDRRMITSASEREQHFSEIVKRFEEIAFSTDHAYWKELRQHLENIKIKDNINLKIHI